MVTNAILNEPDDHVHFCLIWDDREVTALGLAEVPGSFEGQMIVKVWGGIEPSVTVIIVFRPRVIEASVERI